MESSLLTLPPAVEPLILVTEIDDAGPLFGDLFRRKFGDSIPDFPHHVIACYRSADGGSWPLCYVHFSAAGEILLGGGACVDNRRLRMLPEAARAHIRSSGGLYRMTLDWAVRHFASRHAAIFGYCGDALAERIDLAAGFERTPHRHLLVHWTRDSDPDSRARLLAQAHAIGPF